MSSLQKRKKARCGSWSSVCERKLKGKLCLHSALLMDVFERQGLRNIIMIGRILVSEPGYPNCGEKKKYSKIRIYEDS